MEQMPIDELPHEYGAAGCGMRDTRCSGRAGCSMHSAWQPLDGNSVDMIRLWYSRAAERAISSLDDVCIQYDGAFVAPELYCVGLYVDIVLCKCVAVHIL
jgi:hypothetical protein